MKGSLSFFEPSVEEKRELSKALAEIVAAAQKNTLSNFMLDENILHYKHGTKWNYPANDFAEPGEMESVQAEFSVPFDRLIDGDLSLIADSISSINNQLSEALVGKLYATMSSACDRSGNVIHDRNLENSILLALEKVEFSVGSDGSVHLPQLHMHPSQLEKLEQPTAEFLEKAKEIRERKSAEAVVRERERKARYKERRT